MNDLQQYIATMNALEKTLGALPHKVATTAVNFFKERFVLQNWVDTRREPWKPRKTEGRSKRKGRAILVDTARLKRDVQKISVSSSHIVIGTTRLTVPYAKAHNEGFVGTVRVREHKRRQFTFRKESYRSRTGKTRSRKVKVIDTTKKPGIVRTHMRKMNLPRRQFMGPSAVLDRRIERLITAEFKNALK